MAFPGSRRDPEVPFGVPNTPDDGLGERLRRYRADKRVSQAELARQADVSPAYLSELESGAGRRPSGRVLLAIAEALGVTIGELLGREVRPVSRDDGSLPPGLPEFAEAHDLPEADVRMLASIRFRGEPPRTMKRWQVIYDAIRSSQMFDEES
jgi:transcriptional regulator with XRE-family HTH domain